jgi:hypothetical protein
LPTSGRSLSGPHSRALPRAVDRWRPPDPFFRAVDASANVQAQPRTQAVVKLPTPEERQTAGMNSN